MTRPSSQLYGTTDASLQFSPFIAPFGAETVSNAIDLGSIGPRARAVVTEALSTIPSGDFGEVALDAAPTAAFTAGQVVEVGRVRFGNDSTMPQEVRGTVALAFDLAHAGNGTNLRDDLRFVRLRAICGASVALALGGSITAETFA